MTDMSQETRDLYARTLSTMTYVLDVLRDELGAEPSRADWLGRVPAPKADTLAHSKLALTTAAQRLGHLVCVGCSPSSG